MGWSLVRLSTTKPGNEPSRRPALLPNKIYIRTHGGTAFLADQRNTSFLGHRRRRSFTRPLIPSRHRFTAVPAEPASLIYSISSVSLRTHLPLLSLSLSFSTLTLSLDTNAICSSISEALKRVCQSSIDYRLSTFPRLDDSKLDRKWVLVFQVER